MLVTIEAQFQNPDVALETQQEEVKISMIQSTIYLDLHG